MNVLNKEHIVTLVAATGICNLMELEQLIPANSRTAGQIRRIHETLTKMAGDYGGKLDDYWIHVGIDASNAGMKVIKKAVTAEEKRLKKEKEPA